MSGSNACLKGGSNQIYVFIFVENIGDKSRLRSWRDVGEGDIIMIPCSKYGHSWTCCKKILKDVTSWGGT